MIGNNLRLSHTIIVGALKLAGDVIGINVLAEVDVSLLKKSRLTWYF